MMYFPAGSWPGLVVSFSSPMSPVSPGATAGQSGIGAVGTGGGAACADAPASTARTDIVVTTRARDSIESMSLLLVEIWWRFGGGSVAKSSVQRPARGG